VHNAKSTVNCDISKAVTSRAKTYIHTDHKDSKPIKWKSLLARYQKSMKISGENIEREESRHAMKMSSKIDKIEHIMRHQLADRYRRRSWSSPHRRLPTHECKCQIDPKLCGKKLLGCCGGVC